MLVLMLGWSGAVVYKLVVVGFWALMILFSSRCVWLGATVYFCEHLSGG